MLTCIQAAGPISASDLAAATGINDTTISQTLRHLRATQSVTTERDGRVIRYQLAGTAIAALLPERRRRHRTIHEAAGTRPAVVPGPASGYLRLACHVPGQAADPGNLHRYGQASAPRHT